MNQFLKNFNDFNEHAENQKSITRKDYWCPESDQFWTEQTTTFISIHAYIIHVERHVLLINANGEVHVDTAPKTGTDRRKILNIYAVGKKYKVQKAITEDEQ